MVKDVTSIPWPRLDGNRGAWRRRGVRPDEPTADRWLSVRRAALRDHPGADYGLHLSLHRLPAHDQQRLLARLRAPGRGLPPGSRRAEGRPAHDRQRSCVDPLDMCRVRRVDLHRAEAWLDGAQRAGRHLGRHLLAAADRPHLDPQQAALDPATRGWAELREAAARRSLVGFRDFGRLKLSYQAKHSDRLTTSCRAMRSRFSVPNITGPAPY